MLLRRLKIKALTLCWCGLVLPGLLWAQPTASVLEDPRIHDLGKTGLAFLYNMKFAEADSVFDTINTLYPEHPVGAFLKALNIWWKILPDLENEQFDKAFYDAMDDVIARCDRLLKQDEDHFDAMFFKGAALGFRGRLRSNRGAWFKAARDGRGAMKYVHRIAEKDTTNADLMFGKGVYDYFADMVPKKYPIVKPLMIFFPDANRERGLRRLRFTASDGLFIQTEAVYFLLQIYMIYEPDYAESRTHITWLRTAYPDNGFFHGLQGQVYAQWGQWEEAAAVFEAVLVRHAAGQPGYSPWLAEQATYYIARKQLAYNEFEATLTTLARLDSLTARYKEDTAYRVLGRLREGMALDALGRRPEAVQAYRAVLKMKDFSDAHKRAKRYLQAPYGG